MGYVVWTLILTMLLMVLWDTISDFDFNSFTSKDNAPPKAQHLFACALFSISVQDMKLKFDMPTRKKSLFWVFTSNKFSRFSSSYSNG